MLLVLFQKYIKIKSFSRYFQKAEQLIDFLADIHLDQKPPSHLIIEDLTEFIDIQKNEQVINKKISKKKNSFIKRKLIV